MNDRTLIVVLDPEPWVALEKRDFDAPWIIGDREFRDCGLGNIVGHYDWLHTADDQLIGTRTWPFPQPSVSEIFTRLAQHPSIAIVDSDLYVYLTPIREFDPDRSRDVEFGLNWILVDADGTFALTYDTSWRSASDMATIVQWAQRSSHR